MPRNAEPLYATRVAALAAHVAFGARAVDAAITARLIELVQAVYPTLSRRQRGALRSIKSPQFDPGRAPPATPVQHMRELLGPYALLVWAMRTHPRLVANVGLPRLRTDLDDWLSKQVSGERQRLFDAAIRRHGAGRADDTDEQLIRTTFGQTLPAEEGLTIVTDFHFDLRNLPESLRDEAEEKDFVDVVTTHLAGLHVTAADVDFEAVRAAVVGNLLLDEAFDRFDTGFARQVQDHFLDLLKPLTVTDAAVQTNVAFKAIYEVIVKSLVATTDHGLSVGYQELAAVGRYVIEAGQRQTLDLHALGPHIRVGLDKYIDNASAPFGSLDLPPLLIEDTSGTDIEKANVEAVAMIYSAYHLEQLMLFDVVDRIAELFVNGMLPIGLDSGGKLLDKYIWDSEDRLTKAARYMQYSLHVGAPGGDISKEVQPNHEFNGLLLRFVSSVAEYERQQRLGDVFGQQRPNSLTSEQVRKAGRDLAANMSLYGWGYTHFAARRLNAQVQLALDILDQPSVQKAYGVSSPWQVIERVAQQDFGQAPNIVKYHTMAAASKQILDIVAKYAHKWGSTVGRPLFSPADKPITSDELAKALVNAIANGSNGHTESNVGTIAVPRASATFAASSAISPDIRPEDRDILLNQTQQWLAVNGIKDDQVALNAQPIETKSSGSLPTMGGDGTDMGIEQLKQLVGQGQMPTMDQLQKLFPAGAAGKAG